MCHAGIEYTIASVNQDSTIMLRSGFGLGINFAIGEGGVPKSTHSVSEFESAKFESMLCISNMRANK